MVLDKVAERVVIRNDSDQDVNMSGSQLVSTSGRQAFTSPQGHVLAAGTEVTVTSGPNAIDNPPHILRWTTANIWNNSSEDDAILLDATGAEVSRWPRP